LFLLHAVCESVQAATVTNLELNIAALRQLDIKGPDIAVIPLHLGSIADIPVPKTRVASNNLVAFTKWDLLNHALRTAGSNFKHWLMPQTLWLLRQRQCRPQTMIEVQLENLCNMEERLTSRWVEKRTDAVPAQHCVSQKQLSFASQQHHRSCGLTLLYQQLHLLFKLIYLQTTSAAKQAPRLLHSCQNAMSCIIEQHDVSNQHSPSHKLLNRKVGHHLCRFYLAVGNFAPAGTGRVSCMMDHAWRAAVQVGVVGDKSSRKGCRQQAMPSNSRTDLKRKVQPATTPGNVIYADWALLKEQTGGRRQQVKPAVRVSDVASAFEEGILKALSLNLSICRQICRWAQVNARVTSSAQH